MVATAALLVASASGTMRVGTGDTCVANGSGTTYTVVITLPSNAPEQGGFAFGAQGVMVKSAKIAVGSGGGGGSGGGTFTTTNLPANTSGAAGTSELLWRRLPGIAVPARGMTRRSRLTTTAPKQR